MARNEQAGLRNSTAGPEGGHGCQLAEGDRKALSRWLQTITDVSVPGLARQSASGIAASSNMAGGKSHTGLIIGDDAAMRPVRPAPQ
jgi:hypothetical protein